MQNPICQVIFLMQAKKHIRQSFLDTQDVSHKHDAKRELTISLRQQFKTRLTNTAICKPKMNTMSVCNNRKKFAEAFVEPCTDEITQLSTVDKDFTMMSMKFPSTYDTELHPKQLQCALAVASSYHTFVTIEIFLCKLASCRLSWDYS